MWIVWTLICFAVLGWLGYAWIAALVTKYRHTRDSLLVFLILASIAIFCGVRVANQIAPGWTLGPRAAVVAGIGFTLFNLFSFIAINLWCSLLTRSFDDKIASLEEEEDAILRRLDAMRWRAIRQNEYTGHPEPEEKGKNEDESAILKKELESWEQGGGAARIRSLKVLEWREDAAAKSLDAVKQDLSTLMQESLEEQDESKREQAKARAALLRLTILEREGAAKEPQAKEKAAPKIAADEASMRERLQAIHNEIQNQRASKSEFMRQRIRLSWRA